MNRFFRWGRPKRRQPAATPGVEGSQGGQGGSWFWGALGALGAFRGVSDPKTPGFQSATVPGFYGCRGRWELTSFFTYAFLPPFSFIFSFFFKCFSIVFLVGGGEFDVAGVFCGGQLRVLALFIGEGSGASGSALVFWLVLGPF